MRVALVHYHARRGGVTSVVLNQARSLTEAGAEVLIVAGEAPENELSFPFALIKELSYDKPGAAYDQAEIDRGAELLAGEIMRVTKERWAAGTYIVHIHNPLIQKNSLLIPAIDKLASREVRLFLQNHDLAEDFRPDVYPTVPDYPENCHYGVTNSRDYDYLRRAGLEPQGLHLIPNEVFPLRASVGMERTRYLYPVRAIRRKNVGEALLLSLFIPQNRTVAVTLPSSQKDSERYRRVLELAVGLELPIEFGVGLNHSLEDLLGSSVCAISTSVKEGFGFSFLEPWTAGRGLLGRRIDYVCKDFEQAGIQFDSLYSSIEVPLEYVPDGLARKMESAMTRIYSAFGLAAPDSVMRTLAEDMSGRRAIDFGRLDEAMQEAVIRAVCKDKRVRQAVADASPALACLDSWHEDSCLIEENRKAIAVQYGKERITARLLEIYGAVMERQVKQRISRPALLDLYLDPLRLSLVGISDG